MAGCVSTNNAAAAPDTIEQMTAGETEEWVERMAECEAQECRQREAREEEKWLVARLARGAGRGPSEEEEWRVVCLARGAGRGPGRHKMQPYVAHLHGAVWPILLLSRAVTRLQAVWRRRTARRTLAAVKLQAACRRWQAIQEANLLRSFFRLSSGSPSGCRPEASVTTAAVRQGWQAIESRVETVKAFRQLEGDLRAQGIRVPGGAASGGRQRARAREQRRRERTAERLYQELREAQAWGVGETLLDCGWG